MLLNLDNLKEKYDLKIKGVLHIGAHVGQEYKTYERLGLIMLCSLNLYKLPLIDLKKM